MMGEFHHNEQQRWYNSIARNSYDGIQKWKI